jgi:RimJ/RimL family protein N-acetyltransferase
MATGHTTNLFLAIETGGEAVGGIGIHPLDDVRHRSAEIGYWLSESCWGHGIATDAVRFWPLGVEKITPDVFLWLTGA